MGASRRAGNAKQARASFGFDTVPSDGAGWSPHAKPVFGLTESSAVEGVVPASFAFYLLQRSIKEKYRFSMAACKGLNS